MLFLTSETVIFFRVARIALGYMPGIIRFQVRAIRRTWLYRSRALIKASRCRVREWTVPRFAVSRSDFVCVCVCVSRVTANDVGVVSLRGSWRVSYVTGRHRRRSVGADRRLSKSSPVTPRRLYSPVFYPREGSSSCNVPPKIWTSISYSFSPRRACIMHEHVFVGGRNLSRRWFYSDGKTTASLPHPRTNDNKFISSRAKDIVIYCEKWMNKQWIIKSILMNYIYNLSLAINRTSAVILSNGVCFQINR